VVGVLPIFKAISKIIGVSLIVLVIEFSAISQAEEFGTVTAYKLNVRSGPDRKAPSIQVIQRGTRVRILKHVDAWLEIYHEGQTGYIRNRGRYVRIINNDDNMRSVPGTMDRNARAVKRESKDIQKEIEKRKADVKAFTEKETTLINGLDAIDLSLAKARKRASEYHSDLTALEGQIKETSRTVKALLKSIETGEVYVAKRLVALYKMNELGKMQILASADSMYDFFLRKASLEKILAHDVAAQNSLLEKKALLSELLEKLNAKKVERVSLQEKHQRQTEFMSREREKRRQLLSEIRSKKSLELAAIESLQQAAEALDETIRSLGAERESIPLRKKKPLQKPFSALKGELIKPVNGKVVSRFGPYQDKKYNLRGFLSGIYIQADRGEPIHAVSQGTVVYSSWFKGYGNMVIIDHGNSFHTVYAHAEELFKSKGDRVEANEVIATVGDSGSMTGNRLYFEIRHNGKPIDPLNWIARG
jgi:septal ring factor EnvC (AmiA/AmiB activator)